MNKQPELIERTRRNIIDAYWKLLLNKEKLSVISISRVAGVNRSTFYEYFLDIEDLREKAEDQMLSDVKKRISEAFPDGFPTSLKEFARLYAGILEDEGERLFYVLSTGLNSGFGEKLKEYYAPIFTQLFGLTPDMPNFDYALAFSVSAITGIASKWYNDGKKIGLEELLYNGYWLVSTGIFGFAQMKPFNEA